MPMQFKADTANAQVEEIRKTMAEHIAALAACLNRDDEIFAWDNGLAVVFYADGKVGACSINKASTAYPGVSYAPVTNGNRETAKRIKRSTAAANYLPHVCEIYRDTFC